MPFCDCYFLFCLASRTFNAQVVARAQLAFGVACKVEVFIHSCLSFSDPFGFFLCRLTRNETTCLLMQLLWPVMLVECDVNNSRIKKLIIDSHRHWSIWYCLLDHVYGILRPSWTHSSTRLEILSFWCSHWYMSCDADPQFVVLIPCVLVYQIQPLVSL